MVSEKSKAILLLTAHLPGGDKGSPKPLSISEWDKFADWLGKEQYSPENLLGTEVAEILKGWQDLHIATERIEMLLQRGGALALALDKWVRAGIWVVNRGDGNYPKRIKKILRRKSPPLFYGIGNPAILNQMAIGVVGSRSAEADDLGVASDIGRKMAGRGVAIVSGGAKGIDEAAMLGALNAGGNAFGIMADSLLKTASSKKYRPHILDERLVMISPFSPEARFNVGNAMARNKYVYCSSRATVVVHSGLSGGTWNGAEENLANQWVPLWVKENADPKAGNMALIKKGASVFPVNPDEWENALLDEKQVKAAYAKSLFEQTGAAQEISSKLVIPGWADQEDPFFQLFLNIVEPIATKRKVRFEELAKMMNLELAQIEAWVANAIKQGFITNTEDESIVKWRQSS